MCTFKPVLMQKGSTLFQFVIIIIMLILLWTVHNCSMYKQGINLLIMKIVGYNKLGSSEGCAYFVCVCVFVLLASALVMYTAFQT